MGRRLATVAWVVVRQAPVIAIALLLYLILAGFGRALGLPLLFWRTTHGLGGEVATARFVIGLTVGVLLAACSLVASLAEASVRQATLAWFQRWFAAGCVVAALALLVLSVTPLRSSLHRALGNATDALAGSPRTVDLPAPVGGSAREPGTWRLPVGGLVALAAMWALVARLGPRLPVSYLAQGPLSLFFRGIFAPERPVGPLGPIHLVAALLFLAGTAAYLALWCANRLAGWDVYPASAVCLVLVVGVASYGFLVTRAGVAMTGVLVVALVAYAVVNGGWQRARVPSLERLPRSAGDRGWTPIPDVDAFEAWRHLNERKPVLVIVATSGGGIRAAVWTATVLTSLEECLPDFSRHVRLITGASGGMLGASYWTSTLTPAWNHEDAAPAAPGGAAQVETPGPLSGSQLVDRLQVGGLSAVASGLVFRDLLPPPLRYGSDRGTQLEREWERHCPRLATSIASLADGERRGFRPSLVLSPMTVEDGRRLVISNLDLDPLLANGPDAIPPSAAGSVGGRQALTRWRGAAAALHLSTAVRLQANFPWVLPSTEIPPLSPDEPRLRAVDAGYYDDTGVDFACLWLRRHFRRLAAEVEGVVLIQIRDAPSIGREVATAKPRALIGRGLDGLSTPVSAVLRARDATTLYRNDAAVADLATRFQDATGKKDFFVTAVAEFGGEASLSWSLTEEEARTIRQFAQDESVSRVLCGIRDRLR